MVVDQRHRRRDQESSSMTWPAKKGMSIFARGFIGGSIVFAISRGLFPLLISHEVSIKAAVPLCCFAAYFIGRIIGAIADNGRK